MKRLMLAAMESGGGKTTVTCGLLAAWKRRGVSVQAFKGGPDYIDPMFHTRVLGVESRNLDLFLQGEAGVRRTLSRCEADLALIEGAMGFYDGVAGTAEASAWALAEATDTPVVLVLRPKGASLTLAAQVRGLQAFRSPSQIAGVLLSDCKASLAAHLTPILERETGLAVLGYLPPMEEARLPSRHLGLLTAGELDDFSMRFEAIARQMERTVDLDALLALAGEERAGIQAGYTGKRGESSCRIAVARDEAFCFLYSDNLDELRTAGAELVFFSPLHDDGLPLDIDGLYLVGGYPELYAEKLCRNTAMRQSVRAAVQRGLPTVAECGGFLYLQDSLEDAGGIPWTMAGALPGRGVKTARLQRFGYLRLEAKADSLLFRTGETIPAHEFHYWDSTENGAGLLARKPNGSRAWQCGFVGPRLYAGFPHLHFNGTVPLAQRFVEAACRWREERTEWNCSDY